MKKFFFLFFLLPSILFAQSDTSKGIHFEQGLSWEQVKAKAKTENKYIFVDCYATWCVPCKKMDKEVYPKESIGQYTNEKFISVKVQFDSSKQDDEEIIKWYKDADFLKEQYQVTSFPSFLFFTPEGKLIHRDVGYRDENSFIKILNAAANPGQQLYTLLEKYERGTLDYKSMPYLANAARTLIKNKELAIAIAQNYLKNYLYKLNLVEIFTKENIQFIASYIQASDEKGFDIFYHHANEADSVIELGFSQKVIDYIITKEEINYKLYKEGVSITRHPDWKQMLLSIRKKYDEEYADRNIVNAKIKWFREKKQWRDYTKSVVEKMEKYGPGNIADSGWLSLSLNNTAWDIFQYSTNRTELKKALQWSEKAIALKGSPNWMDTKANLLYKLGRIKEAIALEENIIALAPGIKSYQTNLEKMKKGEATWPKE